MTTRTQSQESAEQSYHEQWLEQAKTAFRMSMIILNQPDHWNCENKRGKITAIGYYSVTTQCDNCNSPVIVPKEGIERGENEDGTPTGYGPLWA